MAKLAQGIDVNDELKLYLVANRLKPSSMLLLDPLYFDTGYPFEKNREYILVKTNEDILLNPQDIKNFEMALQRMGVSYKQDHQNNVDTKTHGSGGEQISCQRAFFHIGKDQQSLGRLLSAKTDGETGLALGFPEDAVKAYQKIIDGELRDNSYVRVSLAKAKQAGLELPAWLAYITHVPEQLDLVNGNVSASSKELGEKYQDFVRRTYPILAQRVEQRFRERKLPIRWEKTPDGSYSLSFV